MKTRMGLGLATLAGLFLLFGLIAYNGFAGVARALYAAGWVGILAASLYHVVPLIFSSLGWRAIISSAWRAPPFLFFWVRLVREAVSNLLPVAQIGGEVVAARVLTFHGAKAGVAGASVVVDLTVEIMTQLLFTVVGAAFLITGSHDAGTVDWLIGGIAVAAPVLLAFLVAQHWGLFKLLEDFLERMAKKWHWVKDVSVAGLHNTIKALYRDRRGVVEGSCSHMLSWILGSGEIWIALHFMGNPVSFREALILESLTMAVRVVGFVIPGALGVQEGGFLLVGGLLGLSPEICLALSLVKRARDLLLGVPALAGWHFLEGRRMWHRIQHARRASKG